MKTLLIAALFSFNSLPEKDCIHAELQKKNFTTCVSAEENKLYNLITEYRKSKKLPVIPLSKGLTFVARTHANDLQTNRPDKNQCNMHSWSNKGSWSSCCYTEDHKQANCMWNKPKELSNYPGYGYEISANSGGTMTAKTALDVWKKSSSHNSVIINSGQWKKKWNAIGIGISKNYAVVWFGNETDPDGVPGNCQ
ncbi:MAG TPA: CAP domain-containing protein [Flavobacteriales bacterium]|nr:CAP domain-containing protein [Flavobacteriales bacterium]HRE74499.1 hypothetical protein [Flavobacteriales bacterium]HRE96330.1 hypothetical protein [Flavobacteriales bacterium]HRJ36350.1 hypothetical protein [Flavobacteriales bacterium]HRJ37836.1 hypothetical protein [Flavobacteriales bacterium]